MGLIDALKSWLGLREEANDEAAETIDETAPQESTEEPKLDPSGATETRVKTTDTAVDALKRTQNETADTDTSETSDPTTEE